MTTSPCGISVTSSATTVILGWLRMACVTIAEKPWRSTASAPPAGTAVASAHRRIRLSSRRSSSFSRPTAFSRPAPRRELEQHSSAKSSVTWAGVRLRGFISRSVTCMPRWANCHAHSLPARPAPITVTRFIPRRLSPLLSWRRSFSWLWFFSPYRSFSRRWFSSSRQQFSCQSWSFSRQLSLLSFSSRQTSW